MVYYIDIGHVIKHCVGARVRQETVVTVTRHSAILQLYYRVRCGSDSSAPACCTAGPGSNLGSAPQRRPSTERKAMRTIRVVLYE
jgi:hypothetical protein